MCGIAGIVRFDHQSVDQALLTRMADFQRHRGPDDEGYLAANTRTAQAIPYSDPSTPLPPTVFDLGFAFRRLAILDLSPAGHQPMASADGTCWLVFNGEIYNHDALRCELVQAGYTFRSRSDTEVILAAYQHWDTGCLQHFNGMWAFALWDSRKQRLFCARDRMGVKPFYYHYNQERFIFASEIKTLFADPTTIRQPNEKVVYVYLTLGKVHFGEETFFQDIQQLPAAHYLDLDLRNAKRNPQSLRYWQFDHTKYNPSIPAPEAIEGFRHLFFDSVRLRLQSDVPVGTCLSGGLDSSAIVCVANRLLFGAEKPVRTGVGEKQKTFSACYADSRYDERRWMHAVVRQTGVHAHEVFPDAQGLFNDLETLVWHQDEPVRSTSIYAQWCVMRRARAAGIVVLLDGQGNDELMGGYQRHVWSYLTHLLKAGQLRLFWHTCQERWRQNRRSLRQDLPGIAYTFLPNQHQQALYQWQQSLSYRQWLGDGIAKQYLPVVEASQHPTRYGRVLEQDLVSDTLPALLRYEDRNSMAHSIEARVPFLDYRLLEFVASLPDHHKVHDGQMKWLLRQSLGDLLPAEVLQRRDKIGFETPESQWLAQYRPQIQDYLHKSYLVKRGWVKEQAARHFAENLSSGAHATSYPIWRWLNLEIWLRKFIDREK